MSDTRPVLFLSDFHDTALCYERITDSLARGAIAPEHPFRYFAVATLDVDGSPDVRTVVLRGFDPDDRVIWFHTDVRSPKWDQIRRESRAMLLFYDDEVKLQLRIPVTITLHREDGMAAAAWGSIAETSRAGYASVEGPGTDLDADAVVSTPPAPALDDAFAFGNFVVAACRFDAMDVLELHAEGHRRARISWDNGRVQLQRLAP